MREIKFRGKCCDTWYYGNLEIKRKITDEKTFENYSISGINETGFCGIIPETIGQFTGLHDKNGKEIYEGDIIKFVYCPDSINWRITGVVRFKYAQFFIDADDGREYHITNAENGEVVGNIHDEKKKNQRKKHEKK